MDGAVQPIVGLTLTGLRAHPERSLSVSGFIETRVESAAAG